jgi:hypothetical protein
VAALVLAGCGDDHAGGAPTEAIDAAAAGVVQSGDAAAAEAEPGAPAFGPEVRSLRLRRSIGVRLEPEPDAARLGVVARNVRVRWKRAVAGPGCDGRWVEIEPRGWVCEAHLEPSTREPWGVELPRLGRDEVVPGDYGKVVGEGAHAWVPAPPPEGAVDAPLTLVQGRPLQGSVMVRRWGEVEVGGVRYWRVAEAEREYVRASVIRPFEPSTWAGTRLADDTGLTLPLGFATARLNYAEHRVDVFDQPTAGKRVARLQPRSPHNVLETATGDDGDPLAYRVAEGWVRAADMKIARPSDPPAEAGPGERWIDIDLDAQVLVAYEGTTPVYATLIASGAGKNATPTGVHRMWIKFAEKEMTGGMSDTDAYSVATVPWTQFYAKDLALHTSYWHDRFGKPRSHGCINLAPRDARFLYFWSAPDVPIGWSMAYGVDDRVPGSLIRIR